MRRRPTIDVRISGVTGGFVYARKLLGDGRRGPRARIGSVEEFGAPLVVGEILTIPDDIPVEEWLP